MKLLFITTLLAIWAVPLTAHSQSPKESGDLAKYCGLIPECNTGQQCQLRELPEARDVRSCEKTIVWSKIMDPACEVEKATKNAAVETQRRILQEEYRYCLVNQEKERVACVITQSDWKLCMSRRVRLSKRIDQPVVTRPDGYVTDIMVRPGDQLKIFAGGCVQTGGIGKTWKRYVDPDPSDKHYGTVEIKGVLAVTPLRSIVGRKIDVPVSASITGLRLGYVDDNYTDNGYYKRDEGTGDQCRGVPDAFVEVLVTEQQSPTSKQ